MPKRKVLVEVAAAAPEAFSAFAAAAGSRRESETQIEKYAKTLPGMGVDLDPAYAPVPMFFTQKKPTATDLRSFAAYSSPESNPDRESATVVLTAEVDSSALEALRKKKLKVYPASRLHFLGRCRCGSGGSMSVGTADVAELAPESIDEADAFDFASSAGGTDCRPFRPGVSRSRIRRLLGVWHVWLEGFLGQNVVVAVVDEGVNGQWYPVIGGYEPQEGEESPTPGSAPITSHGSMCAADVLVAAPWCKLLDYPLIAEATTAEGMQMYQAILEQRRQDGTPQVATNSYGFYGVPPQVLFPEHETRDISHPFHRKVREVIASGASVFFAAGNCGSDCPSGNCRTSAIGAGRSINASAALAETNTIAAVNSRHERIGYSSQGPSLAAPGFEPDKPDFAAYSHFFGNFGPGRPGGLDQPFDNGTSAACPVAAGVGALLLSAFPSLTPLQMRAALRGGAIDIGQPGRDSLTGHGVVNAAASYLRVRNGDVPIS